MIRILPLILSLLTPLLRANASPPDFDPIAAQVTIYRDEYGVPHIVGETEEATFFGYGYAQAEDHLERQRGEDEVQPTKSRSGIFRYNPKLPDEFGVP